MLCSAQDVCQHGRRDLALSLLRVGCTLPSLRSLPLGSALLESLVVYVMRDQHPSASDIDLRRTESDAHKATRRSSYTEQALAAAAETAVASNEVNFVSPCADSIICPLHAKGSGLLLLLDSDALS